MNFKGRSSFFYIVVVCFCVVSAKNVDNVRSKRSLDSEKNCDNVKQFFALKNVTVSPSDGPKGKFCAFYLKNTLISDVAREGFQPTPPPLPKLIEIAFKIYCFNLKKKGDITNLEARFHSAPCKSQFLGILLIHIST